MAFAIDLGIFVVLYEFVGFTALASHSFSFPLAAIFSFTCNAFLNFRKTDKLLLRFVSFLTVIGLGYLLGAAVILVVDEYSGFNGTAGKIVSLPLVAIFQYFLNARISFRG